MLGDFSYQWGREAAAQLLEEGPLPDAIVCGADIIALGPLSTLQGAGVTVPGDVLVTGYDDIGFAALSNPGLTTVGQPVERLGRHAVGLLRARFADGCAAAVHEVLQPRLVVRGSSGAPAAGEDITSPASGTDPSDDGSPGRNDRRSDLGRLRRLTQSWDHLSEVVSGDRPGTSPVQAS